VDNKRKKIYQSRLWTIKENNCISKPYTHKTVTFNQTINRLPLPAEGAIAFGHIMQ
jgi:hypothetical protein